jgi:hypothetical protein
MRKLDIAAWQEYKTHVYQQPQLLHDEAASRISQYGGQAHEP